MIVPRITAAPAIRSAMVAEFLMGTAGLGHMFRTTTAGFQTDRAFGTSLVATMISVFCLLLVVGLRLHALKGIELAHH